MISIEQLKKVENLQDLNDEQLTAIAPHCNTEECRRDDMIFSVGDDAGSIYFVLEGSVDLRFELTRQLNDSYTLMAHPKEGLPKSSPPATARENTISSISEGNSFGWTCFVPPYRHCLSAYCASESCRLLKINKSVLLELFAQDHRMGYLFMSHIIRQVGMRFQQLQNEIINRKGYEAMFSW